jgi:hypothetical protein
MSLPRRRQTYFSIGLQPMDHHQLFFLTDLFLGYLFIGSNRNFGVDNTALYGRKSSPKFQTIVV